MSDEYIKALLSMGYDEIESKILSALLKDKLLTAEEIEEKSGVSKSKAYQVLKVLEDKGLAAKNEDRPAAYFVTNKFIETIENDMETIYQNFIGKLQSVKLLTKKESFEDVLDIFKHKGYDIKEAKHISKQIDTHIPFLPGFLHTDVLFEFIAEGDFKLAISFIDKEKEKFCENIMNTEDLFSFMVYKASQQLECVSFCIFISPKITIANKFYEFAKKELETPITRAFSPDMDESDGIYPRFIGIEDLSPKIILLQDKIDEEILVFLNSLRNRRDTTERLIKELNESVERIDQKIGDSEALIRHIPQMLQRPRFPPFRKSESEKSEIFINKIKKPVIDLVKREKVNLFNLKKYYLKENVKVNEYIDLVDRRLYYPSSDTLDKIINTLSRIQNIVENIHFEINTLDRELLTALRNISLTKEEQINPFIFTIPFEETDFIINQENAKLAISNYIKTIKSGDQQILSKFIFGKDGIGKTHLIKYFAIPEAQKQHLLSIYITCSLTHDLIKGLSESLLSLEQYPNKMQAEIKLLQEGKYLSPRDLVNLFEHINDISLSHGNTGTLICIDEFENTLPYFLLEEGEPKRTKYTPLSLTELNTILESETLMRLGLLIASRDNILSSFKEYMTNVDIKNDILQPQPLSKKDVKNLIEHRYELWNTAEKLKFNDEIITKLAEISHGNARSIVKYCRQLHGIKMKEKVSGQTYLDNINKRIDKQFNTEVTIEHLETIAKKDK